MNEIQMVDLKTQNHRIQKELDEQVINVIHSAKYINGPEVKLFSDEVKKYLEVSHTIPCANGTDALQIALMALELEPGDEVITPSFTYVATVEVIALLKLIPVFVEVYPDTFTIDTAHVERAINKKTKAIIAVHLYGQCADMERLREIATKNKIYLIEDTAQAFGSEYYFKDGTKKKAGTVGDIGSFSFFPSKNLGCFGDGGMICTNNDLLGNKMLIIANHGQTKKYHHDSIGVNSRLDTLQAGILLVKFPHLKEYIQARRKAADYYDTIFREVTHFTIPCRAGHTLHTFHQYTLKIKKGREALITFLKSKNIPSVVYYPIPLHLQKGYVQYEYKKGDLPVTEHLCEQVLSLPMHTELDEEQLHYISENVRSFDFNRA